MKTEQNEYIKQSEYIKGGLKIDFSSSKIKFDIFSQAEENLFIDLLVKKDDDIRDKANSFGENNLNFSLGYYLELGDEEKKFLKSKSRKDDSEKEVKREYMSLKYDLVRGIKESLDEKEIKLFQDNFPIFSKELNEENIKKLFNYFFKNEDIKKPKLSEINSKKELELKHLKGKFVLIPFIFVGFDNENNLTLECKYLEINTKERFVKNQKEFQGNAYFQESEKKIYLGDYIILDKKLEKEEINYLFEKTDIFCDYKYIDKKYFDF